MNQRFKLYDTTGKPVADLSLEGIWSEDLPSARQKSSLRLGDRAKLKVVHKRKTETSRSRGEFFWATVTQWMDGAIIGRVMDRLSFTNWHELFVGADVKFQCGNIIEIERAPRD